MIPLIIVLIISCVVSYFVARGEHDYLHASKSVRWPLMFGTLLGTQVGAGFLLGNTEAVWEHGPIGIFYGLGLSLGLLGLGLGYAQRLRTSGLSTLSEVLGRKYGSAKLQRFASLLSVLSMGGVLVAHAVGLRTFLISLSLSDDRIFLLSWGAVVMYTTVGGFLAVVWTDLIQTILIIGILVVMVFQIFIPHFDAISFRVQSSSFDTGLASLFIPFCFIFVAPHMVQRCVAARTPEDASKACIATAGTLAFLSFIPLCCGLLGQSLHLTPEHGAIFMQVATRLASPFVGMCAAMAVLLALISTTSSVLLAITANIVQKNVRAKTVTFFVGFVAYCAHFLSYDIVGWLISSYELCVAALLVPLVMALYSKKELLPQEAAWGAVSCGTVGLFVSHIFCTSWWACCIPVVLSCSGYVLGGLLHRKEVFEAL